ncbi:MAG: hypothetical protein WCJ84_03985 [Candidatus Peregrinibacteria bacterium]
MSEIENITPEQKADASQNKDIAAFAYTLLFAPILLITRRESPFILFHARQALILFIFAVIFWSFAGPLRYFNIFVLVGCAVGFLHAMGEEWYQMPFVYEFSKGGISPSSVWAHTKNVLLFLARIFAGILPKKIAEKINLGEEEPAEESALGERMGEIEKFFCIEKYFRQQPLRSCSEDFQTRIEAVLQNFRLHDEKMTIRSENDVFFLSGTFGKVVLGGFSEQSFFVGFSKKAFPKHRPKFHLGDFGIEEVKKAEMGTYSFL